MKKYPTDIVYFIAVQSPRCTYVIKHQSKYSSRYVGKKFGTLEEAEVALAYRKEIQKNLEKEVKDTMTELFNIKPCEE